MIPTAMRAMVIHQTGPASVFTEATLPVPVPAAGEVLVKVEASSVNPIDTKIRSGAVALVPDFPAVLHGDMAGVVVAVGQGVTSFKAGDAVYGMIGGARGCPGALAEYAAVDARLLARKPAALSFAEAAALPVVALTAWEGLFRRAPQPAGAHVLVHAATGGVGHIAIQMAKHAGLRVAATVSGEPKAAIARQLGADDIILYRQEPVADYVARLTKGRGFDLVIDTVGGDNLAKSFAAAKYAGQVVCIAARGTHDLSPMHGKGLSLHVVFKLLPLLTGEYREQVGEDLKAIAALADAGGLRPLIDAAPIPFADVARAHERAESGQAVGKVVLSRW